MALGFSGDGALRGFEEWFGAVSVRASFAALYFGLVGFCMLLARRALGAFISESTTELIGAFGDLWRSVFKGLGERPVFAFTLLGLTTLGFILRIQGLDLPTTTDEAQTIVQYASRSPLWIVSMHATNNNHVPFSLLVHGLGALLGYGVPFIRWPAVAAGLALIPLTYGLARACVGRQAATIASSLVAANYQLVAYSSQARGYTLMIALFLLGGLCVTQLTKTDAPKSNRRVAHLFLLGLFCSLAMWTIVSALYAVVTLFLWWFASIANLRRWNEIKDLMAAGAVVAVLVPLLYLPVLLTSGAEALLPASIYSDNTRWESLRYLATEFPVDLSSFFFPGLASILIAAGGLVLLVGIWTQTTSKRNTRVSPALVALVTIGIMLPIQSYGPSLAGQLRSFIWMIPFLAVAIGAGSWALFELLPLRSVRTWHPTVLAIGLTSGLLIATPYESLETERLSLFGLSQPTETLDMIQAHLQPGDAIVSPNRLGWNLRYQFLIHGLSMQPFHQAEVGRSGSATRILLVRHTALQDEERLVEEIWTRRAHSLRRPLTILGTRGNTILYATEPF